MRNTKNAFTLVELIVVITILAILGTIAFISLQGYSADARNSKRTSDIGNIQSAISLKQVEGVPLLSFIADTTNKITGAVSLAGSGTYSGTAYTAGTPSYTVLNVIQKDFLDPKSDHAYAIGATTLGGGVFQVAATMEQDGVDTAKTVGTFSQRLATAYSGTGNGTSYTLSDVNANRFKVGDTVTDSNTAIKTITKVSRDGITLTLSSASTGTTLALSAAESNGLIGDTNLITTATLASTGAVTNLSTTFLPY
jgi:prepilin-type N-terminal cleavage/methylation domain-containing protein